MHADLVMRGAGTHVDLLLDRQRHRTYSLRTFMGRIQLSEAVRRVGQEDDHCLCNNLRAADDGLVHVDIHNVPREECAERVNIYDRVWNFSDSLHLLCAPDFCPSTLRI